MEDEGAWDMGYGVLDLVGMCYYYCLYYDGRERGRIGHMHDEALGVCFFCCGLSVVMDDEIPKNQ